MIRYVIHPGFIISQNDGQKHYVTGRELMRLYGVKPSECVVSSPQYGWCAPEGCTHLRPRNDGNYELNSAGEA